MASSDGKRAMSAENGVALAEWLKSKMGGGYVRDCLYTDQNGYTSSRTDEVSFLFEPDQYSRYIVDVYYMNGNVGGTPPKLGQLTFTPAEIKAGTKKQVGSDANSGVSGDYIGRDEYSSPIFYLMRANSDRCRISRVVGIK